MISEYFENLQSLVEPQGSSPILNIPEGDLPQEAIKLQKTEALIRQFNLMKLIQSPNEEIPYKIVMDETAIKLLLEENKDKKCVVTSFLGLKESGKTTIMNQFINCIDPSIQKEDLELMQKNKQNGNCFLIEKNDKVHLIIEDELFGICKNGKNLFETILAELKMQCVTEQISDFSYFIRIMKSQAKMEEDCFKGLKQLQRYILGDKNKNNCLIINRTSGEGEQQSNKQHNNKENIQDYNEIYQIRDKGEKIQIHDVDFSNYKNEIGFYEDIWNLVSEQGVKSCQINQTCFHFVKKLEQYLFRCQNQQVQELAILQKQSIHTLNENCYKKINEEISQFYECSNISQDILDYLQQQIIETCMEELQFQLKKQKQVIELRQYLIGIICEYFLPQRVFDIIIKKDSFDYKDIVKMQQIDTTRIKKLEQKIGEEKNIFQSLYIPILGHLISATISQKKECEQFILMKEICSRNYLNENSKINDILNKKFKKLSQNMRKRFISGENLILIKIIILISKQICHLNQVDPFTQFVKEQKEKIQLNEIINLFDLGSQIYELTNDYFLNDEEKENIKKIMQKQAMDKRTFQQLQMKYFDNQIFMIEIPDILLSDKLQSQVENIIYKKEQLWFSLVSIQLVDKSFILQAIVIPNLLRRLEQSNIRLADYLLEIYKEQVN